MSPSPTPPSTRAENPIPIQIHTYHCLCTIHLLTTPYTLSSLPRRAPPALDKAFILPLGSLTSSSSSSSSSTNNSPDKNDDDDTINHDHHDDEPTTRNSTDDVEMMEEEKGNKKILPSLLSSALRAARKIVVVRREDGFEKRRVWRCGRCGVGVGYEVVGSGLEKEGDGERGRVMFLLEGGLREMEGEEG